jgi:cellulose synthase/poly-beta-1,6-N-acetylglucosamine synthase-like glycosyltransferase
MFVSYFRIRENNKRKIAIDYERYTDSDNTLPVSLLIPAHNEQENIVDNIKSLMKMDYPEFELVVVNDGSTDNTHEKIITAFGLREIEHAVKVSIPTKEIRGIYYNAKYPNLLYVDKENGGKSDALNAGINVSFYPLFACLDADSRLETDAILKLSMEFLKDTQTVVAGGLVRVANGSVIENGEWKSFRIPETIVERFQIVEYFRAFLSGRVSWGPTNSLLIVSGAFGLFNKSVVIECGGYKNNTIGEDMEIIIRIHEYLKKKKAKYNIQFREDAVCWTQGPSSLKDLRSQRRRWQIGLFDSLLSHKKMILNPRYSFVGMLSMPYYWIFELLGAPIEVLGYFIIPISLFVGELSLKFFFFYLTIATCLGIILSIGGLILEQKTDKGCMTPKQCLHLTIYAFLENFGYRQLITLFRVEGMLKYRKLKTTWGKIKRKEFNK